MIENGIINIANMEDCPSNDFKEGTPQGKCWGCGHYMCRECKFYREDFFRLGQNYIDFIHNIQSFQVITFK